MFRKKIDGNKRALHGKTFAVVNIPKKPFDLLTALSHSLKELKKNNSVKKLLQCKDHIKFYDTYNKKNFMASFYGWDFTDSTQITKCVFLTKCILIWVKRAYDT